MPVTLQQLRYFVAVAEHGSFTATAHDLYTTQSNLSASVSDLERELGIEVFNRSSRGVTLTSAGVELLSYARQVLEQVGMLEDRYAQGAATRSRLAISSQHYAFAVQAFLDIVDECAGKDFELTLRETTTRQVIDDVASFRSDVGILYLVYYDYMDARSISGNKSTEAAKGQGAVENAMQSIRWFKNAVEHPGSLTDSELNAAQRYGEIGEFYEKITKANREGADSTEDYRSFWGTLEASVVGRDGADPLVKDSDPIVKLRIYQVAFESVSSSTYLTGFRRAGVSKEDATRMLDATCAGARALEAFANMNEDAAGAMYHEIVDGEKDARANIDRVYRNALVQQNDSEEAES